MRLLFITQTHIRLISMWIRLHEILLLRTYFSFVAGFSINSSHHAAIFSFVSKRGGLLSLVKEKQAAARKRERGRATPNVPHISFA